MGPRNEPVGIDAIRLPGYADGKALIVTQLHPTGAKLEIMDGDKVIAIILLPDKAMQDLYFWMSPAGLVPHLTRHERGGTSNA